MGEFVKFDSERANAVSAPRVSSILLPRRVAFAFLVLATITALGALMAVTLSAGGFSLLDLALTACFLVTLPWTVVGFWNALIGLLLMRASADPTRAVCPVACAPDVEAPIGEQTAMLVCVRNEDANLVSRNLNVMIEGLVAAGVSERFHLYVLSDSSRKEAIEAEADLFRGLEDRWRGIFALTYRHREENPGFKAGNIRDFCERWGHGHAFALVLDADSLMSTEAILRLIRTMQQNPRLGILQHLTVGMPTLSPFARLFQVGMRLGMRSYTLGSAWWQGDCGPYWGHNALIRLKPFIEHCQLPKLTGGPPLGGWILSHDQVEAVLMRRAGYEVRVLPEEGGSWEENPPTLLDYIRRDLRWCQGNMQYWRLLAMPGLMPVSRAQLLLAILMFVSSPFWILFMTLGMLRVGLADDHSPTFDPETGPVLLALVLTMIFAPKLATLIDVLASAKSRRAFGGGIVLIASFVGEALFSMLLAPVMALAHTRFLIGLAFGRAVVWSGQRRAQHQVSFSQALRRLWPQTLLATAAILWLALAAPAALFGFLPFLAGAALAVPIAVVTSNERLGILLARLGLWRIPDESDPADELQALYLSSLRRHPRGVVESKPLPEAASGD